MKKTKKCGHCKKFYEPTLDNFHKNPTMPDGLHNWCKQCSNEYNNWYRTTPNGKANREKGEKKYRKSLKGKTTTRRSQLLWRFGITLEQYDQMLAAQDGKCAICGRPETHTFRDIVVRLAVDHNHTTGKIRQLLCHNCNTLIGYVEEDPQLLQKMIAYLEKFN